MEMFEVFPRPFYEWDDGWVATIGVSKTFRNSLIKDVFIRDATLGSPVHLLRLKAGLESARTPPDFVAVSKSVEDHARGLCIDLGMRRTSYRCSLGLRGPETRLMVPHLMSQNEAAFIDPRSINLSPKKAIQHGSFAGKDAVLLDPPWAGFATAMVYCKSSSYVELLSRDSFDMREYFLDAEDSVDVEDRDQVLGILDLFREKFLLMSSQDEYDAWMKENVISGEFTEDRFDEVQMFSIATGQNLYVEMSPADLLDWLR